MMPGRLNVRILGCGSSGGVPRVGNNWGACNPTNPRNQRSRCSVLLRYRAESAQADTAALIDTSPDLRTQLLASGIRHLDAVLLSHFHADQCHGIDDVRPLALTQRAQVPVYMDEATAEVILQRFHYCFKGNAGYPPILDPRIDLAAGKSVIVAGRGGDLEILALDLDHGTCRSLGFRVGPFAYCNDVVEIPEASFALLDGVETLVVDALRYTPHPTHAHVEKALEWIDQINPKAAILTNMHVDLDYDELDRRTPDHVKPAFDGLELDIAV